MNEVIIKETAKGLVKNSNYSTVVDEVKQSKSQSGIIRGINFLIKNNILYLF